MHEFLHFMISYRSQWLQKEVPIDLDKAESYGYQHIEEWRQYYIDIMNGNLVLENGEKTGITDKAFWNITPHQYQYHLLLVHKYNLLVGKVHKLFLLFSLLVYLLP